MYDVVIIGAGLGGLECGALLAQSGRKVLVLEQGRCIGGCLQTFLYKDMTFDTGFHYVGGIGEGQSLHKEFAALHLLDLPWQRLDIKGFEKISIGKCTYTLDQGFINFAQSLISLFPMEREGINSYVSLLRQVAQAKGDDADALNKRLMEMSAWKYLTDTLKNPHLIDVVSGASMKMELRRATLPLFTFAHVNSSFVESSWKLKGGGIQIANRLADVIRNNGGEIVCKAKVEELVEEEGRISKAICSNGETYEAGVFVSDIHPSLTCQLVKNPKKLRPSYLYRMNKLENTVGMFTVQLRLRQGFMPYFNYNHYIYRHSDVWSLHESNDPVGGIMISTYPPNDGSRYAKQVDLLTPVPISKFRQWESTSVGRRGSSYRTLKEKIAIRCVDIAEEYYPGLTKASRPIVSTPLTWRDYTLSPNGSAFGIRKNYNDTLSTIISPCTPLSNLFLTGQSLMVHGVHGVTKTAFQTAELVMSYE